ALRSSIVALLFFFSSRRRHTRFSRDWSSDVCSSDLNARLESLHVLVANPNRIRAHGEAEEVDTRGGLAAFMGLVLIQREHQGPRSEERRVGKECRSRGPPAREKKKERRDERNLDKRV